MVIFKIFTDLLDIDPNSCFLPPARRGLRGHTYKIHQGASHHRRRGSAFSVDCVKYWNKLPVSVFTGPSFNAFKKKVRVWTVVIPLFPQLNGRSSPHSPHPPKSPIISICYPTPCSLYVVSSGPLWPPFCHYKSLS